MRHTMCINLHRHSRPAAGFLKLPHLCHLKKNSTHLTVSNRVSQCYIRQLQELRRDEQQLPPLPPPQQAPSPSAVSSGASASAPLLRHRSIDPSHSPLARSGALRCAL